MTSDDTPWKRSLEEYIRSFMADSNAPDSSKADIQALWASHLTAGQNYRFQGLLREAIVEYEKEHNRPIKSSIDAEIVQKSYALKGKVYRELGELDNAVSALQKARELLAEHRVGMSPQDDLAEILIAQGRYDEAIAMCQEVLDEVPSWPTKQLLAKAIALKGPAAK